MAYKFSKGTFNFGGTLDLSGGDVDLPSGSVDTADIGHAQVDSDKLAASVAGAGLAGANGDPLAVVNATNGGLAVNANDMQVDLNDLAAAAVNVANDSIAIVDADDSNASKKESIADLMTAVAGSGLAAASGVLSVDIDELSALGGTGLHQTQDHFMFSDNGTEKKITFSNLQDAIFADVSGDATVAAGGALTIAADAVESGMLNDNVISGQTELAHADIADADEMMISDGGTLKKVGVDSLRDHYFGAVSGDATVADGGALTIAANAVEGSMLNDNVISGQTDIGAALAATDELMVSDAGSLRRTDISRLGDFLGGDGLSVSSGVLAVALSGALKITSDKVGLSGSFAGNGLSYAGGVDSISSIALDLNELSAAAVDVANDSIAIVDAGDSNASKKESIADLMTAVAGDGLAAASGVLALDLNELTAAAVDVANDSIAIIDANDSNGSRKESVADLATAMAGDGLAAASGVFALDLNELTAAAVDVANDSIAIIDANDSNGSRKESIADLVGAMAGTVTSTGLSDSSGVLSLDIQNMTVSTSISDSDLVVIDDGANGTLRKMTRAHFIESAALDAINIDGGSIDGATLGANAQVVITNADMNGGSIDGTAIGAASPSTAVFTTATVNSALLPDASGGADLGSTTAEFGDIFIADDKYLKVGSDQDAKIGYNSTGGALMLEGAPVAIQGDEAEDAKLQLKADQGDDAGDSWQLMVNKTNQKLAFGNDIASQHTYVSVLELTPHATAVSSSAAFAGDVTISGNLTVSGDTSTISTTNTVIADKFIELANGTSGTPSGDAGFVIERGDQDNVALIWDESADLFALIDGSFTGATSGNLTISDYMSLKLGALTATDASDFEAGVQGQEVRMGITAAGEIDTASGNLTLDSAGGTVIVDDMLEVESSLGADGNFRVGAGGASKFSIAAASGNTSVAGTLEVTGNTTLSGLFSAQSGQVVRMRTVDGATATLTTDDHFVLANRDGAMTITLPDISNAQTNGFALKIKAGANCASGKVYTITGSHAIQTMDGASSLSLNSPYAAVNLVASGSLWYIW